MDFQDKSIQCSDCGVTFSVGEQEFFQSKGFTLKALPMSLSVVQYVVEPTRHSTPIVKTTATALSGKCLLSSTCPANTGLCVSH
jgi:hypothetical protein